MRISAFNLLLIVLAINIAAVSSDAASVALRVKSQHHGAVVYLGDVADISAANRSELENLKTTALMPAPAPGTHQFLTRAQVRDLLVSQGVEVERLTISGATSVELGQPMAIPKQPVVELPSRSRQQIEDEVEAAVLDYLTLKTGHDRWRVEIDFDIPSFLSVANSLEGINVSGGRRPWTGRQLLKLSVDSSRDTASLVANITKINEVIVAVRDIPRGNLIRATDLEVRMVDGSIPSSAITSTSQLVGMEANRPIRADQPILKGFFSAPLQVERGETVTVFARTEGISVRTFAISRQDGALGELIQVETLDKKDRYVARVSGRRELEVLAAGTTAGDYANLPRHNGYQR